MNQEGCALRDRLEHWRWLIEPEIAHDGLTPVSWDELLSMPGVMLYEGDRSVVLAVDSAAGRCIWLAAGVLEEVSELVDEAQAQAARDGVRGLVYVGRRGWIRALGFTEVAVVGTREVSHG